MEVIEKPLAVRFSFPGGRSWSARLDGLPNPQLALDLAHGMVMCFHPYGRGNAVHTARHYVAGLRNIVRALAEAGFTGPAGELTRPMLLRYWMSHSPGLELATRGLLRGCDAASGALRPEVGEHLSGRAIHAHPKNNSYQPYTDAEWARLSGCCQQHIEHSWARHRAVLAGAGRAGDPRTAGVSRDSVAWLMLGHGPLDIGEVKAHLRGHVSTMRRHDPAGREGFDALVRAAREALFPTYATQTAYRLLFGVYTGIVPDGIDSMGLGDIDWAGDHTILLDYVKGRTGPEGLALPSRAVRLLTRWLEHSAPLRRVAPPPLQDRVWIAAPEPGGRSVVGSRVATPSDHHTVTRWAVEQQELRSDDGSPLAIHRSRIRTTYQHILARQGWTGRTTIDPNHTARVEGDHYLSATTPGQRDALESIVEQGQADLLRRALPPVVLCGEQAVELVAGFPDAVARLGLDEGVIAELVGGRRDVFTAACVDQLAGAHGPKGAPCPARPWVCLLCPLAVFLPRHAPNLLRLRAFFARQSQQMPTEGFLRVFGPYADRLDNDILPRLPAAALAQAAGHVRDTDTELPLRPEETTT
ncbi:hypothetical protein ACFPFQ_07060 [Pseudonocardia sp. GCM10023141]